MIGFLFCIVIAGLVVFQLAALSWLWDNHR